TFTIIHSTGGISGTFAGLAEGATVTTSDGTPFTISYQGNGGHDVVLTQDQVQAPSFSLHFSGLPASTVAGNANTFTVTAQDAFGHTATGYTGTVHFNSRDGQAGLPGNYTFTSGDSGVHTFSATLKTVGTQSLTATDTVTGTITGSQTGITVNP